MMKTGGWFANILKKKDLERLLRLVVSVCCTTIMLYFYFRQTYWYSIF